MLFSEINKVNNENRNLKQQLKIVRFISKAEQAQIIPDISKHLKTSAPTTLKLLTDLIEKGYLKEEGKKETTSGRKPILYSLNKEVFYSIGVEIDLKMIRISLIRIDFKLFDYWKSENFELKNNEESLETVINALSQFISKLSIRKEQLLGIGIGLTGRVNTLTGDTISFFEFLEKPFAEFVSERIGLPVFVENDSRVLGLKELISGRAKGIKNSIIINAGRGLGMCLITNGQIVTGGLGFAGEFGHMQFGDKKRHCICGKQNCLGTEVSGFALEEDLKLALKSGKESAFIADMNATYHDILNAAIKGDSLAIDLLQKQGEKLGSALGNILNLINPEKLIIGGELAITQDLFLDAIKIGLKRTALINTLDACKIENSQFHKHAGVKGSAALVFNKLELI